MATADYFDRAKVAAAQVIAGFDVDAFTEALNQTSVGISLSDGLADSAQGRACADPLVRLFARLYPSLAILAPAEPEPRAAGRRAEPLAMAAELKKLATDINPAIALTESASTVVHIGDGEPPHDKEVGTVTLVYAGSDDWTGRVSLERPLSVGNGPVPVGAGIAACLAASAVFRLLLDPTSPRPGEAKLSAVPTDLGLEGPFVLPARTALAGAGAVGQAVLWTLARSPVRGDLHLIEPERVELSNLQRYVLTDMHSVDQFKTEIAFDYVTARSTDATRLGVWRRDCAWAEAMTTTGSDWDLVAVAVDTAEARRAVQASLPKILVNAWTQTGDLGVSAHRFLAGACCACLYLPTVGTRNEDELVAEAFGVPDRVLEIRNLLYTGLPVPDELLGVVADRLSLDPAAAETFRGATVRDLYVQGVCGGALIPLAHHSAGSPVHVPLAHQSALAGVLLAARVLQATTGHVPMNTEITRVDVRRDPPDHPHQSAAKDPRGICMCQDHDFVDAYRVLWPEPEAAPAPPSTH